MDTRARNVYLRKGKAGHYSMGAIHGLGQIIFGSGRLCSAAGKQFGRVRLGGVSGGIQCSGGATRSAPEQARLHRHARNHQRPARH